MRVLPGCTNLRARVSPELPETLRSESERLGVEIPSRGTISAGDVDLSGDKRHLTAQRPERQHHYAPSLPRHGLKPRLVSVQF